MVNDKRASDKESIDDIVSKRRIKLVNSTKGIFGLITSFFSFIAILGIAGNLLWLDPKMVELENKIDVKYQKIIEDLKAEASITHNKILEEAENDDKATNARMDRVKANLLGTMNDKNAVVELELKNLTETEQILFDFKYASKEELIKLIKDMEYIKAKIK